MLGTHEVDGTCPGNAPVQPARGRGAWGARAQTQRPERAAHCRQTRWSAFILHRSQSQTSMGMRMEKKHGNKSIRN